MDNQNQNNERLVNNQDVDSPILGQLAVDSTATENLFQKVVYFVAGYKRLKTFQVPSRQD